MEMGLGIHGEPGAETLPVKPVDEIVAQVPLRSGRQTPAHVPHAGVVAASAIPRRLPDHTAIIRAR
jgi:dihydroxyacetone kinase